MAAPSATGALSPPRRFSSAKPAESWRLSSRRGSPRRVFIWGAALFSAVGVVSERVPGLRSREKSRCTPLCRLESGEAKGVGWGHETEGKQAIWLDATWLALAACWVACTGWAAGWRGAPVAGKEARPPRQCRGLPHTRPRCHGHHLRHGRYYCPCGLPVERLVAQITGLASSLRLWALSQVTAGNSPGTARRRFCLLFCVIFEKLMPVFFQIGKNKQKEEAL